MSNTFFLIRKDVLLLNKYFLLLGLFYLYMGSIGFRQFGAITMIPAVLLLINACNLDIHYSNQRFVVSLPVTRNQIVRAKYLSVLPYMLFALACSTLMFYGLQLLGRQAPVTFWHDIMVSSAFMPIFASVYLPIYYWVGPKGSQVVTIVFMMIGMFGATYTQQLFTRFPSLLQTLSGVWDHPLSAAAAVVLYAAFIAGSAALSTLLFARRDI